MTPRPENLKTDDFAESYGSLDYDTSRMEIDILREYILRSLQGSFDLKFLPRPFWSLFLDVRAEHKVGEYFGANFRHWDDIAQKKPDVEGFQNYASQFIDFGYIQRFSQLLEEFLTQCLEQEVPTEDDLILAKFLKDAFGVLWWDENTMQRYTGLFEKYQKLETLPQYQSVFV